MYSAKNGQTGITFSPRSRADLSAKRVSAEPIPCPLCAGGTSVWVRDDFAVAQSIFGDPEAAVAEVGLEAVLFDIVANGIIGRHSRSLSARRIPVDMPGISDLLGRAAEVAADTCPDQQ